MRGTAISVEFVIFYLGRRYEKDNEECFSFQDRLRVFAVRVNEVGRRTRVQATAYLVYHVRNQVDAFVRVITYRHQGVPTNERSRCSSPLEVRIRFFHVDPSVSSHALRILREDFVFHATLTTEGPMFRRGNDGSRIVRPLAGFVAFRIVDRSVVTAAQAGRGNDAYHRFIKNQVSNGYQFACVHSAGGHLTSNLPAIDVYLFGRLNYFTQYAFQGRRGEVVLYRDYARCAARSGGRRFPFSCRDVRDLGGLCRSFYLEVVETVGRYYLPCRRFSVFRRDFITLYRVVSRYLTRFLGLNDVDQLTKAFRRFIQVFPRVGRFFFSNVGVPGVFSLAVYRYAPMVVLAVTDNVFRVRVFAPFAFLTLGRLRREFTVRVEECDSADWLSGNERGITGFS